MTRYNEVFSLSREVRQNVRTTEFKTIVVITIMMLSKEAVN